MIGKLLLCLWILRWTCPFGDFAVVQGWSMGLDESLDERNDAEIFRAVVESMRRWTMHKKLHHRAKREVSKVCYEDVGCFEDTGPFSYLEMLPSPPRDVGTRFLVYGSRKARSIPMEVPADDINDNAHRAIDPDLPTKVIVHGFGSSCDHVWVYEMRSALMTVHECNIVCVDWGPGSAVPNYVRAAANTRLVGRQLAKLIRSLNVPLEKVHLIGFSLGAHVAGFAGAELGNVSRITGLDPAGPLFESQDPRARLDATDANFVDVIHSNGEQLLLGGLGSWQPMGDVDFYPNGGRMQTGCSNLFLGAVSDIIWSSAVEGRSLCNHRRAYKLFTDSVSPKCRFPAFSCNNGYDGLLKGECFPCSVNGISRPCGDMGYYSDDSPARGQLYLVTRDEEPFCAHQYQVKVYNSRSERPTRSYGKLQVSLVGEAAFNETFAMTRKDEELLVGAVLQKIVVPHPAITNVEAIEIKYTAYSGWISSGLVSWSIDKVAIIDSFGKTLSMCRKGLILESGHPVYLPLFPGDCTIPQDNDNATLSSPSIIERLSDSRQGGIGPFTKEQNYEKSKDAYAIDFSDERSSQKGIGPFTKDQNIRVVEGRDSYKTTEYKFDDLDDRRADANPWTVLDISGDGDSNSLENSGSETGRGFSGSNHMQRASSVAETGTESTTEYLPEIREPVLRLSKKETGRSLRFPEITEPILRPRATRQNAKSDVSSPDKRKDDVQEPSLMTSRSFTVQFLPERLAGILAQAERYARQTLLPLISQYTPSFVGGGRYEEPKYFPPLGDLDADDSREEKPMREPKSRQSLNSNGAERETETRSYDFSSNRQDDMQPVSTEQISTNENSHTKTPSVDLPPAIETVYPEKRSQSSNASNVDPTNPDSTSPETDQWIPINSKAASIGAHRESNVSLDWTVESSNPRNSPAKTRTESTDQVDDWVPITDKSVVSSTPEAVQKDNATTTLPSTGNGDEATKKQMMSSENEEIETTSRKFIPLIEFEDPSGLFPATSTNNVLERRTSTVGLSSHIQKIPRNVVRTTSARTTRRSMVFPYAYERRKDPSTRYIPLIPEEDLGRSRSSFERFR